MQKKSQNSYHFRDFSSYKYDFRSPTQVSRVVSPTSPNRSRENLEKTSIQPRYNLDTTSMKVRFSVLGLTKTSFDDRLYRNVPRLG